MPPFSGIPALITIEYMELMMCRKPAAIQRAFFMPWFWPPAFRVN
jgi:hypothetical protein